MPIKRNFFLIICDWKISKSISLKCTYFRPCEICSIRFIMFDWDIGVVKWRDITFWRQKSNFWSFINENIKYKFSSHRHFKIVDTGLSAQASPPYLHINYVYICQRSTTVYQYFIRKSTCVQFSLKSHVNHGTPLCIVYDCTSEIKTAVHHK